MGSEVKTLNKVSFNKYEVKHVAVVASSRGHIFDADSEYEEIPGYDHNIIEYGKRDYGGRFPISKRARSRAGLYQQIMADLKKMIHAG